MKRETEKLLLQAVVLLACLVPVLAGAGGIVSGTQFVHSSTPANLDSHMRYLSGLLLGIGFAFLSSLPRIEHNGARFRLLTLIVVTGGMGRLFGFLAMGVPGRTMQFALVMELVVTPLLYAWQRRVARRYALPGASA